MGKNENIELEGKCLAAAKMYLRKKGMEILNEEPFECEHGSIAIVAEDPERGIVFVDVAARRQGESLPTRGAGEPDRGTLEEIAMAYLATHEAADCPVTFDQITVIAIGEERALLKYHINCLS